MCNINNRIIILVGILAAFLAVSCQKDTPKITENGFEYDGVSYNTLQDAVSAAEAAYAKPETDLTYQDLLDFPAVKVMKDAYGDGARVSDDFDGAIVIDFQDHKYTLSDGANIYMPKGKLMLKGDGGCLTAEGSTPSIECEKSVVLLGLSLKVSSPVAFKGTRSVFTLLGNFEGALEGDVILDLSVCAIYSLDADIHIPTLKMLSDSYFYVLTQMANPAVIDRCELNVSPGVTPISADYEGSVKVGDGSAVHVHDWDITTTPATCVTGPKTKKKCKLCGQEINDIQTNALHLHDYGPCAASNLIHHPAKEATETEFGNIEYWECSKCGKQYGDPDAESLLSGSPLIKPDAYNYDQSVFNYGDMFEDLFSTGTKGKAKAITKSIKLISKTAGMGDGIAGLFSGDDNSEEFDAINERLDKLDRKMDELGSMTDEMRKELSKELEDISNQLGRIDSQLDNLGQAIDEISETISDINYNTNLILTKMSDLNSDIEATQLLSTRHNNLVSLKVPTESVFSSLIQHANDFTRDINTAETFKDSLNICIKFKDNIKNAVVNIWNGTFGCVKTTSDLMAQFSSMSYGASSTFPKLLKTYANSHVDWENQAYSYRVGTLEEERYILSMSFALLQIYYCFIGDHYVMENMLNAQYAQDTKISDLTDEDIKDMQACYNDYRLYNPANLKFKTSMIKIDYYSGEDNYFFSSDNESDLYVNESLKEEYYKKQGIYKNKCMGKNDLELIKNCWQNSGMADTVSFEQFMCASGIGGVEFLGGTGSMVFPFIDDEPFKKEYISNDFYSQTVSEFGYYEESRYYKYYLTRKIWRDSLAPCYSPCCILYNTTETYKSLSTGEVLTEMYGVAVQSIKEEQPDSYAFNTCTPQFY